jgi:magnesium-transporting ATPase (P-type)
MAILEIPEGKRARNRIRKDCAMNPQRNPTPPSLAAPLADLYSGLQATDKGLTSAEVKRRLAAYGANDPRLRAPSPLAQELTAFVSNPLVIILVLAAVISGFLGDIPDAVIIIVVVSLSSILNFIQSYRSHKAVEELRNSLVSTATARSGSRRCHSTPSREFGASRLPTAGGQRSARAGSGANRRIASGG